MNPETTDPVIDEIRAARHRISERVGHDPARLVAYYLKLQEQFRARLINPGVRAEDKDDPKLCRTGGETAD